MLGAAGCGLSGDRPASAPLPQPPEATAPASRAGTYRIVTALSRISFVGSTPVASREGWFGYFWGTIELAGDDVTTARVDVHIDMRTTESELMIYTRMLKGPVFFNVAKNRQASFVSTAVRREPTGDGYTILGNMTFRGVTRPITVPSARLTPTADGLTLEAQFTLRQSEFGMVEGAKKANDAVPVTISLRAVRE